MAVEGDSAFGFSGMECETICRWVLDVRELSCGPQHRRACWGCDPCCACVDSACLVAVAVAHTPSSVCVVLMGASGSKALKCLPCDPLPCCRYKLPVCIVVMNNGEGLKPGCATCMPTVARAA